MIVLFSLFLIEHNTNGKIDLTSLNLRELIDGLILKGEILLL